MNRYAADPRRLSADLAKYALLRNHGVACMLLGRRFIGIERDLEYMAMARKRVLMAKFESV